MTGHDDKTEDQAYDSLIEELGLDLSIDEDAIGAAGGDADGSDVFSIRDADAPSYLKSEGDATDSGPDGGIELPADLMAELKAVIGVTDPSSSDSAFDAAETDEDASVGGDVFAVEHEDDAPPYVEDAFTINVVDDADVEDADADTDDFDLGFDAGDVLKEAIAERDRELAGVDGDATPADEIVLDDTGIEELAEVEDFAQPDAEVPPMVEHDDIVELDAAEEIVDHDDALGLPLDLGEPDFEDAVAGHETPSVEMEASQAEIEESRPRFSFEEDGEDEDLAEILKRDALDSFDISADAEDLDLDLDLGATVDNEGEATFDLSDLDDDQDELPPLPTEIDDGDDEEVDYSFVYGGESGGDRLVPRITIHAFCQTAPTTRLLTTAQNDRRMANVAMEVHQGGVPTAIDYYADKQTPHLMIVESTAKAARLLGELDDLAQRCDENVKVIVVGAANDIRLYRELMRRGVSEYLVPPLEPVQVIRAISALFVDTETPFVGKSIAVTGVKGGVGASTVAHNLAWSLSQNLECSTTLVDLDLNFGTAGLDFNQEGAQTIADAIGSPDRFDEAVLERLLNRVTDKLSVFTAPSTLDRTYDLEPAVYEQVMGLVRQSVPFAVLDLPHIWTDWFKTAVVGADDIVVVAQPDLASLRNGKNLIDFLKAARPNDAQPRLVINNVGVPKRPEIPVKDFAQAIGIDPELVLPFDPQLFGTAGNNGQMIADVAPESKCAQGMDYLASVLSGREIPRESGSLLSKLFKK